MKKLVLACASALLLAACSAGGNAEDTAKEALTKIYTIPYAELNGVEDVEEQKEIVAEKFEEVFAGETELDKAAELVNFSAAAEGLKVKIEKLTLKETAENQWSYDVTLKADDGSEATSFGAIALNDGQVSVLKVYEAPAF